MPPTAEATTGFFFHGACDGQSSPARLFWTTMVKPAAAHDLSGAAGNSMA
jgi:hypothetical protein